MKSGTRHKFLEAISPSNQDLPSVDASITATAGSERPEKLTGPRWPLFVRHHPRGGGTGGAENRGKEKEERRKSEKGAGFLLVVRFLEAVVNWIESGRIEPGDVGRRRGGRCARFAS